MALVALLPLNVVFFAFTLTYDNSMHFGTLQTTTVGQSVTLVVYFFVVTLLAIYSFRAVALERIGSHVFVGIFPLSLDKNIFGKS